MKKHFLISLLLGLPLCVAAQHSFSVSGETTRELNGKYVYLVYNADGNKRVDSVKVSDGKFTFAGEIPVPCNADIDIKKADGLLKTLATIFLENGNITVDTQDYSVGGTTANNEWNEYLAQTKTLKRARETYQEQASSILQRMIAVKESGGQPLRQDSIDRKTAQTELSNVREQIAEKAVAFVKSHPQALSASYLMAVYIKHFSLEEADSIMSFSTNEQKQTPMYKYVSEYFGGMHRSAVGVKYTDLEMLSPEDKPMKLSDYVGKHRLVMVDFWASWCGPCLREMPHVKEAYEKYHAKGLEIVGVSFDSKKDNWVKSIEKQQLKWPNMSDLKGWKCAASSVYGIKGIPASLLIDQNGIIVGSNLRGDDLINKIAELLD